MVNVCVAHNCLCYLAINELPLGGQAFMEAGAFGPTCSETYASVCANNVTGQVCSGHGLCFPDGCDHGLGSKVCTNRNGRPRCHCHPGFTGDRCQHSVCGGVNPDMPCSINNMGVNRSGHCNIATGVCECESRNGMIFSGPNCEHAVFGCTSIGVTSKSCSGHGTCHIE